MPSRVQGVPPRYFHPGFALTTLQIWASICSPSKNLSPGVEPTRSFFFSFLSKHNFALTVVEELAAWHSRRRHPIHTLFLRISRSHYKAAYGGTSREYARMCKISVVRIIDGTNFDSLVKSCALPASIVFPRTLCTLLRHTVGARTRFSGNLNVQKYRCPFA